MPLFDERTTALSRADFHNAGETRAKLASWEFLVYQSDQTAALNAKNALVAAIEAQHAAARALVDRLDPRARRLNRPRSKDEEGR
jgi:hypothetical protein